MRRKTPNGIAMATLLMVVALASVVAFSLAGGSILHLNVAQSQGNSSDARNCADAATVLALEKTLSSANLNFGVARTDTETLDFHKGSDNKDAEGQLTFSTAKATELKIPYSTNNLASSSSTVGWSDRVVPQNSLHLIGVGKCNGAVQAVEAIIHLPPFPYCIATSGKFVADSEILVAAVTSKLALAGGIEDSEMQPGHLLSNNTGTESVTLNGNSKITGDVQTAGEIKKNASATIIIGGEEREKQSVVSLPDINLDTYDPSTPTPKPGLNTITSLSASPTVTGFNICNGTLTVSGDLNLSSALLFVKGDLFITGGVKGKGAIVCKGNVSVGSGCILETDNQVAMLAQGNVTLGGVSPASSSFQGLVYTKGDFTASDITICGAFINAGSPTSQIHVTNVKMVGVPEYQSISVSTTVGGGGEPQTFHIGDDIHSQALLASNPSLLNKLRTEWSPEWTVSKTTDNKYMLVTDGKQTEAQYFDKCVNSDEDITKIADTDSLCYHIGNWVSNELGQYIYTKKGQTAFMEYLQACQNPDFNTIVQNIWGDPLNQDQTSYSRSMLADAIGAGTGGDDDDGGSSSSTSIFLFNLNDFLRPQDRMKVVLWRMIPF
ncbi:MAG: hypothetical protein RDV48_01050 [Candidatus Eremiobacteraeota bacterium]|nr:hypothetical protein [Candidatus Eremiobacteraeota bacterium]